jgi:TatD DNase family protein
LIDTHCHLDSARFEPDRTAVLERAYAAGVQGVVIPAVGPDGWEGLLAWPKGDARVQVGLGIHPQWLPELDPAGDGAHLERLDGLLGRKEAAAVGECGVDGPTAERCPLERQVAVLEGHLALADKHGLPALVHCLKAHPALQAVLERRAIPEAGLLLHSYSGGPELVKFYASKGCHFSLAGPVTYAGARKPLAAARAIPLERLMVETDAPDQSPHPHRGGRNEPGYLGLVVAALAQALGMPSAELGERTAGTARAFFRRAFEPRPAGSAGPRPLR